MKHLSLLEMLPTGSIPNKDAFGLYAGRDERI
jgi:hypothetical protein